MIFFFFFSSRRRHTRFKCDWSSDVCSSDLAAKAMTGVVIVRDGDFVGVAAPSAHVAQRALDAIHAQWKEVPQISSKEIFSYLKQNAAARSEDRFRKQKGSVEEGFAAAAH